MANADIVRQAFEPTLARQPTRIAFDVGELRFIDSSGLAVLLQVAAQTSVELRHPLPLFRRVIELTGLSNRFDIRD